MLEAIELRKSYGDRCAVANVSLRADPGRLLGLLGPNGAGKSTTIGMLSGLIAPDAGAIQIDGRPAVQDTDHFKRRIGLVPQDLALYEDLSAGFNLELFGALYGLPAETIKLRVREVLELVGLSDRIKDQVDTFSGGMKRRLNIAAALMHDPDVLLLDEPTAGVDPQSRNAIFENLEALKARGKAIIYTTHYMEEVERLADSIVIIDHGKVVGQGTKAELFRLLPAPEQLEIVAIGPWSLAALQAIDGVKSVMPKGDQLVFGVADLSATAPRILASLSEGGARIDQISSGRITLETVFLHLTGRELRD